MVWYLVDTGNLHNGECLIHIFTGEVLNGNQIKFNNSQYCCCYKYLRDQMFLELINTTHLNVLFLKPS